MLLLGTTEKQKDRRTRRHVYFVAEAAYDSIKDRYTSVRISPYRFDAGRPYKGMPIEEYAYRIGNRTIQFFEDSEFVVAAYDHDASMEASHEANAMLAGANPRESGPLVAYTTRLVFPALSIQPVLL